PERFTECLLGPSRDGWDAPASSDNDEPADLLAQFAVDRIDVDTAHDLLTVSRDQIPRDRTLAAGHGILAVLEIARRFSVEGDVFHEIPRERVNVDRALGARQVHEGDLGAGRILLARHEIPLRAPLVRIRD